MRVVERLVPSGRRKGELRDETTDERGGPGAAVAASR